MLTIGEVARRSGVAASAFRFYEERGLVASERHGWRIDERIAELERLRAGLTECIGCGCLSLDRCGLTNPGDRAAGPGPSCWLGDPPVPGAGGS